MNSHLQNPFSSCRFDIFQATSKAAKQTIRLAKEASCRLTGWPPMPAQRVYDATGKAYDLAFGKAGQVRACIVDTVCACIGTSACACIGSSACAYSGISVFAVSRCCSCYRSFSLMLQYEDDLSLRSNHCHIAA